MDNYAQMRMYIIVQTWNKSKQAKAVKDVLRKGGDKYRDAFTHILLDWFREARKNMSEDEKKTMHGKLTQVLIDIN